MSPIQDTLEYLVKSITSDPDKISVESSLGDDQLTVLTITAPAELTGQLIGKQGKIIKALRVLLSVAHPEDKFTIDFKN